MVYHSQLNDEAPVDVACGCGFYEAPHDMVGEVLKYFKANVLSKTFEIKGAGDRTLVYLTLFICQCVKELEKKKPTDPKSALNVLNMIAINSFSAPGDATFALRGILSTPEDRAERDRWTAGMKAYRVDMAKRLSECVFDEEGNLTKWWLMFAKYKFMNKSL